MRKSGAYRLKRKLREKLQNKRLKDLPRPGAFNKRKRKLREKPRNQRLKDFSRLGADELKRRLHKELRKQKLQD